MNLIQKTKDLFTKQNECKTQGGVCYPKSDWAHTPTNKPSDWSLLLSQSRPGNITRSQLGRAAAAFSPGGFRGRRVQLSPSEATKAKSRIRREYTGLGVRREDMPDAVKEKALEIWLNKETGEYRWLAIYSNNYRDNDNPPEIISEASHKSFVKGVETGVYPYPELWLWHVPGSKIGRGDWVAYTDEGFALASGTFDEGKEHVAQELKGRSDLVSHGMPKAYIKYDPQDSTTIIQHITKEISPLPSLAAANKLTGFELLSKEESMIPEHKLEYLKAVGISNEEIEQLQANIGKKAEKAREDDLESKEGKQQETPIPEDNQKTDIEELTLDAIGNLLQAGLTPIATKLNDLESRVKELEKSDEEKITEKAASIPSASRAALLQQNIEAALFNKDTQVDGRSSLAKSGPKQTDEKSETMFFENWLKPVPQQEAQ